MVQIAPRDILFSKRIGKIVDEGTPSMEQGGAKFAIVYADPPWMYQHPVSDSRRSRMDWP